MRPSLALAMSTDGVILYAGLPEGWLPLGRATFSNRNVNAQMAVLRRIAQSQIDGDRLEAVLIVPESQVLWQHFGSDGVGAGPAPVNAYLAAQLDGLTPYDVSELRFDWRRDGSGLAVAVIAVETMTEAEAFAAAHGFSSLGVMTLSESETFEGTAWFGRSVDTQGSAGTERIMAPRPDNILRLPPAGAPGTQDAAADLTPAAMAARVSPPIEPSEGDPVLPPEPKRRRLRGLPILAGLSVVLMAALVVAALILPDPAAQQVDIARAVPVSQVPAPSVLPARPEPQPTPSAAAPEAVESARIIDIADEGARTGLSAETMAPTDGLASVRAYYSPSPAVVPIYRDTDLSPFNTPGLDIIQAVDALALDYAASESIPPSPLSPAPPPQQGARFDVDASGLVRPSPDGADAPGGYRVMTGPPSEIPPQRQERNADTEGTTRLAENDNPMAKLRPPARPDDLVERYERLRNGGLSNSELARLRPAPRPAALAAAAIARIEAMTPQVRIATAQTTRPSPRPASLASRNTRRAAQNAVAAASTAAVLSAPRQPETQTRTPERKADVPATRPNTAPTNVARRATDSNELNLKKVNLLGTFGKTGSLRALVRMPSGRVMNVSVGDRVDGGRVVAIAQGELRYVKGGRNHVLTMPRG